MIKDFMNNKEEILNRFGKMIRNHRCCLKMSQVELAKKTGFHVNYIGRIERGTLNLSLTGIICLADALGLLPKDMF